MAMGWYPLWMQDFEFSARVRSKGQEGAVVTTRKVTWEVGLPLQFDVEYDGITAVEQVAAAVAADLVVGLKRLARRKRLDVDNVEALIRWQLGNPLVYLGVVGEEGSVAIESMHVRVYVETLDDEEDVLPVWEEVKRRSPLFQTFSKISNLKTELVLVM